MYEEIIALFLKINPNPSDQQFHALAMALGTDPETLESVSYSMLSNAEDLLENPEVASLARTLKASRRILASRIQAGALDDGGDLEEALEPGLQVEANEEWDEPGSTHIDNLEDPEIPINMEASSTHSMDEEPEIPEASLTNTLNASYRLRAYHKLHADDQDIINDPTVDPDEVPLSDVALNDGDPTDDDLGFQEETGDDGYTVHDVGVGTVNTGNDVLNDDGAPDLSLD